MTQLNITCMCAALSTYGVEHSRWQRRPEGKWYSGFPDKASFKLVEMDGKRWVETVASLHLTNAPDYGRAATLYLPSASSTDPERQDLIVLLALFSTQQEIVKQQNDAAAAA